MPTINIDRDILFTELGKTFSKEEFEEVCFEFGIELEEETSENQMASKEVGTAKAKGLSTRPIYRIDIPANRIDLLCPEGLVIALKVYLGISKPPIYTLSSPQNMIEIRVSPDTSLIRPFVVCAVLRDITFTPESYANFIELQEKLHSNICRKRTLVAIGTHDLDSIKGPFSYEALPPSQIKFVPLNQTVEMNGHELMEFYEADKRLSKFLPIIKDSPVFPVIYDANRQVLSLPPIINSDHSKIKLTTKNVFIECTATDYTKAKTVLNDICIMFSQYCKIKIEPVRVIYKEKSENTPSLDYRIVSVPVEYITSRIGVSPETLSPTRIVELLTKMGLSSNLDESNVLVKVPPSRSDILHMCDIMEDVAIAYGFNNIIETIPKCNTIAVQFPLNKMTDDLRRECAFSGFTECSHDENFGFLGKVDDGNTAVKLANPKTLEYQVVRTSLIPGILKTIKENKKSPLPLKLFEVSDIVFKNDNLERRAQNQRNLCVVYSSTVSGFEIVHGMMDRVFQMFGVANVAVGSPNGYYIKPSSHPTYFPGRCADIYYNNILVGNFGIMNPSVLEKFEIGYPTSCLEMNIEYFL